jgi:bifunctional non-homologous end joining protein LigD
MGPQTPPLGGHKRKAVNPAVVELIRDYPEYAVSHDEESEAMSLEEYETKRDFRKTPEPSAQPGRSHRKPIFVVQEHHATRLHYDFRLEADGVLKSWAVPKEPSLDPAQKRLAVRVEDHPLAYASFAGTIPAGQYGGGTVRIWDHGTYDNLLAEKAEPKTITEGIAAGRLEFTLHGEKLEGRFALIRMRAGKRGTKENWLLIKMKDEHARPTSTREEEPAARGTKRATPAKETPARTRRGRGGAFSKGEFEPTNTDRVLFSESGITKGDVLDYYRRVAKRLLPYLRDGPSRWSDSRRESA